MIKVFTKENVPSISGTSLAGYLQGFTYDILVDKLGEPTFDTPSGDDKVQIEWIMEYKGNIFTLYDWKTYNREYTIHELIDWHVGSKVNAGEFIEMLERKLLS
jgi:hypothetical protein